MSPDGISHVYTAPDGLRLHVREHAPAAETGRLPLVCLAGLTRSADDFAILGEALAGASATPRRVLAFDYRGRGRSDHDPDWRHYDLAVERTDVLAWLDANGIAAAHVLGTSRGGLHIMALATARRSLIRGVVLNDIGPVLEPAGLLRLKAYVGKPVEPRTVDEAVAVLKRGPGLHFDGLTDSEWQVFAAATFGGDPENLRLRYDPALARVLDGFDLSRPLPELWEQYDALRGAPVLTIRGANSDLLSAATLEAMARRWPGCEALSVPGQGHAPLLADAPTIARIDAFLAAADAQAPDCSTPQ